MRVLFCELRTTNMEYIYLKTALISHPCTFLSQTCPHMCSPVNTHGVLVQMFLHIFGFESSGEKAHCLHGGRRAGTPKQEGLAPAFPGTRTLTLWQVVNFSAPNSLSKLAPHTRCPFIQTVSPCPGGRPRNHAQCSSSLVLKPLTETRPRQPRARSSKPPAVCRPRGRAGEDRPQTRSKASRLFPITRGRGSVPKWRHFLHGPLLQNAPFDKPGDENTGRGLWELRALLALPFIQFTLIRPTLANESVLFPSVCMSDSRGQFEGIGFPLGNAGISMI